MQKPPLTLSRQTAVDLSINTNGLLSDPVKDGFVYGAQCSCVARGDMPQVDADDLPGLFQFFDVNDIAVSHGVIDPRLVRGRQKVDRPKVRAMPEAALIKPVLISSDFRIIDGNHRWMAHIRRGTQMPYIQINVTFEEALLLMFKYPQTYRYGDGNEHPIRI